MKVLVVDADADLRDLAAMVLQREGYTVLTARDGEEAIRQLRAEQPDLVLVGLGFPPADGSEVCRKLRSEFDIPIVLLSARDTDEEKVVGFELRADDELTQGFNPRELVARVKALLRRGGRPQRTQPVLTAGPLTVDRLRREARSGNRVLGLRAKEFDLLVAFVEHAGLALSRKQILEEVWGYTVPGQTRTVDVHVNHLRRQLVGTGVTIETLRGVGYKLVVGES